MRARGLGATIGMVAMVAAGCGGSTTPPRHAGVHLDGKRAQGNYVVETDASGAQFMVPAPVVAGQGGQSVEVSAPTAVNVGRSATADIASTLPYRSIVAEATALVPHSAHVEILATGVPGSRFQLSWTETCGWTQQGKAAAGGTGGGGLATLRSPAVLLVKLPRIDHGVPSCYLGATASMTTFTRGVHVAIIDY